MVLLKNARLFVVGALRRVFVSVWVLPYLHRYLSEEGLVDFKVCISEEIAPMKRRWIARDDALIETWQVLRAVKQRKHQVLNFNDSYRRLK